MIPMKWDALGFESGQSCGKMDQMKSEAIPRTGIADAISTGLTEAARRPWLWIVPIVVDLVLWLAPRLSISALTSQLMAAWRALLPLIYTPDQMAGAQQGIDLVQTSMVEMAKSVNLSTMLTAGWMTPPSALTQIQATRYLLISDAVLAPVGLGVQINPLSAPPWQTVSLEIGSVLGVVGVVVVFWLISQLVTALYFRIIATTLPSRPVAAKPVSVPDPQPAGDDHRSFAQGWLRLAGSFAVLSLIASFGTFMLRLPLILVTALAVFAGSGAASFLFVLGGGVTLWLTMWFLSSLFFVGDALAFDRLTLWPSFLQSLMLVRGSGFRVLVLASIVNLLMLGARAVWGILGANPAGALLAIIVNGYLATAMTIGIFVFYRDLRRHWQSAQLGRQLTK
jgi:hypothetical protein